MLNFSIHFHSLKQNDSETIFEDDTLTVRTLPLDHKIPTCGFLFSEKPKSLRIDKAKLPKEILIPHIAKLKMGQDVLDENGKVLYRSQDHTLPARASYVYAYCSDTQPTEAILPLIEGVDLLYHEATFLEDEKEKARETKHSTAAEAAGVAKQCHARKLIIGHFSARYKDLDPVLAEAIRIFPDTKLASEGETFELTE